MEKTAVARLGSGIAGKKNPRLVVMAGKDLKDGVSEARSSRARSWWADSLTSAATGLVASLLAALITGGIASTSALKNLGIASAALITVTLAGAATGVGLAIRARRRPTVDSAHAEQLRKPSGASTWPYRQDAGRARRMGSELPASSPGRLVTLPPASQRGFAAAELETNQFATDLMAEAGPIARRYGAEEASPDHVRSAAEYLYRSGGSRREQVLASLGGTLAGIGGSAMVGFLQVNPPNSTAVGLSAAVMVAGVIGATVGLVKR